jgi:predicted molibdopterin-dependent oxidoreductase YjgC
VGKTKRYDAQPLQGETGMKRCRSVDYVSSPALKRNENRCILCGRRVRACKEVILTTGRLPEHFHTGTMTRNSRILDEAMPEGFMEINPQDARHYDIGNGEVMAVSTRRGSIRIKARFAQRMKQNVVFIPFHFYESCANTLTVYYLDPVCKIPEFKVCSCRIEKITA